MKSLRVRVCQLAAMVGVSAFLTLGVEAGGQSAPKIPGTKSGFVTTADGVKIHYLESRPGSSAASGASILFVPGWTMPAWIWEKQIEHFSKTHRVVAMDPRCQGESSQTGEGLSPEARARDIKAVVDRLHLAPVVIVAWSMAVGETAAYVAQFGTQDIAGLVLVDDAPGADLPDTAYRYLLVDFIAGFVQDRPRRTAEFARTWFKKPQPEEYIHRVVEASLRTPTSVAAALLAGKFGNDLRPALAKIDRPTLICAAGGPYQRMVTALQSQIPGSRVEIFAEAGHALFVDEPARFNSLLEEFVLHLDK